MSFVNQRGTQNRKTAVIGVAAIHVLIGTVVITGLAPQIIEVIDPPPPPITYDVEKDKPPAPPKPDKVVEQPIAQAPDQYTPKQPIDLITYDPTFNTSAEFPDLIDTVINDVSLTGSPIAADPRPLPSFAPFSAAPRNDPGRWVTTRDYKRTWVSREMTGTGQFTFSVAANGRVTDCRVVSSTGHSALDRATCRLVSSRARFNAARDNSGNVVAGDFNTSIVWQLPD